MPTTTITGVTQAKFSLWVAGIWIYAGIQATSDKIVLGITPTHAHPSADSQGIEFSISATRLRIIRQSLCRTINAFCCSPRVSRSPGPVNVVVSIIRAYSDTTADVSG